MALRAVGAQPVTAAQLEQALVSSLADSEAQIASELSDMRLTERLNWSALARLTSGLHGKKEYAGLDGADGHAGVSQSAAVLDFSRHATQRAMMAKVVDYVARINHRLPNFFAMHATARFEDWPKDLEIRNQVPVRYSPPRMVHESSAIVRYRER